MPIALTDKIVALLASLTDDQIEALPPAERRRLEHQCMAVMVRCCDTGDRPPVPPARDHVECRFGELDEDEPRSSGVLSELRRGHRNE